MKKIIVSFIIFLTLFTYTVVAQEEQFGISINCVEDCKDKEVDNSKDIMLLATIKNNLNYWVSLGDKDAYNSIRIIVKNTNLEGGRYDILISKPLGDTVFIRPQSKKEVYIPFTVYNELNGDARVGNWEITPELNINSFNVKFYPDPFDSEATPLYIGRKQVILPSTIKGNILEFKSVKPEIKIEEDNPLFPEDFWDNPFVDKFFVPIVVGIIILVVGSIIVAVALKKK